MRLDSFGQARFGLLGLGEVRQSGVALGDRGYDVLTGRGLLGALGPAVRAVLGARAARAFVVHDENLPEALTEQAVRSLRDSGFEVVSAGVEATEKAKSIHTATDLLQRLARTRHERRDLVVALGGGVVGDLTGFVAAIYRRGVPVVQCPTTLLAMVDAAIGGKTGVNLDLGTDARGGEGGLKKNLIGAFHQPVLVLEDVDALASLPERHLRAGLAECVKHAMIGTDFADDTLLKWIEDHYGEVLARKPEPLIKLIGRNVSIKSQLVARDEREEMDGDEDGRVRDEQGRMLLNLGHTFGHAMETIPHLSPDANPAHAPLHHGEAVALGLVAACAAGEAMGKCGPEVAARVRAVLEKIGLPTRVAGLPPTDQIVTAMKHDKKVSGGQMRIVVPVGIGRCRVVTSPPLPAVEAGVAAIRQHG
jgi:3-dehydroquinate synthetase